jgi:hypothetical protein
LKTIANLALCSIAFLEVCCRPPSFEIGSGGSIHEPPDHVVYGQPAGLKLLLVVSGEGSGKMSKRYRDVQCHHRLDTESDFRTIAMRVLTEDADEITFVCEVPPATDPNAAAMTYYFDMVFDGHYNKIQEHNVPIQK